MEESITNKVANSKLITLNIEDYYPQIQGVLYDIKDNLHQGLVLKEKDFRTFLKNHSWQDYRGKDVAITCSADAIVPTWAYMLLVVHLQPHASQVVFGTLEDLEKAAFLNILDKTDFTIFRDQKVIIKGCSHRQIPTFAYVEFTHRLYPYVASMMYGEACSTVILHKRKKISRFVCCKHCVSAK